MNKGVTVFAVLALLVIGLIGAMAATKSQSHSGCPVMSGSASGSCGMTGGTAVKGAKSAICPVMGKTIPDIKQAAAKSVYKGKTYYFCCQGCKPKFDKDPQKYIKLLAAKQAAAAKSTKVVSAVCPVMGNRIPDVSKAAAKSVYKGTTYYFCCPDCKPQFDKNPENYIHKHA